jgi:hypothetical protein
LTPANFTTLAHFSVSFALNTPKSAGEPPKTQGDKAGTLHALGKRERDELCRSVIVIAEAARPSRERAEQ